ncbi:MAG: GAF domain-containing protein [Candidatus Aminicenantes bacterium]|nr:GAF domain-containing protein [Candidatus Aminicenantes bacterium]
MKLICIEGQEKDTIWELPGERIVIGRDSVCDIVVNDAKLSRIHAEIIREGDSYIYHDKESLNGSFINNDQVSRQILISGDEIRIGDTRMKVLEDDLTTGINWQKDDPLITSKIPLDQMTSQIEKAVFLPETAEEKPEVATDKHIQTAKLIKNLETIYEVGKAINSIQTVDELLDQIAETLLSVYSDVQRVCILLEKDGDYEPKFIKSRSDVPPRPFQISRSIIKRSVEEEVCILANDASSDDRFVASESVLTMNLRSVMCAPLVSKGAVLGLIYLDNREKPNCFDENDVALLSALANQSAIAIDNSRLYEDVQKAYHESILALMNTVEAKDPYTRGHSQRTSRYALGIAQEMGLNEEECKKIKTAAELHDIGKIGVRDLIIGKESPLSTMEFHTIQAHVLTGENILKPIGYLNFALPMVRSHHEKYDGSGYPDGLKGDKTPLGARILGAADTFDAMTTQRPYNKPLPFDEALEQCKALKGKQFDPKVIDALDRFVTHNISTLKRTDEFPESKAEGDVPKKEKSKTGKKKKK